MSETFSRGRDRDNPVAVPPQMRRSDASLQANLISERMPDKLRAHQGQWVAVKDGEMLVAALSPGDVVDWLARHDQHADSMFRVPEDELAFGGLAPL